MTFNSYSKNARDNLVKAMVSLMKDDEADPIIMCIGTDKVTGDCLGPLVGHLLVTKYNINTFVYGTLDAPITATNLITSHSFIRTIHPDSKIIAVDAALGRADDVGIIKVLNGGIMPGSATNKNLPYVGDISVMGIVNTTGIMDYMMLQTTRLSLIYNMAETIAAAITDSVIVKELTAKLAM